MEFKVQYLNQIRQLVFDNITYLKELEEAARHNFKFLPDQFYFTIGSYDGPVLDQDELNELKGARNIQILLFIQQLRDIEPQLIEIKSQSSFLNLEESKIQFAQKSQVNESNVHPQKATESIFLILPQEEKEVQRKIEEIPSQPPKYVQISQPSIVQSKEHLILNHQDNEEKQLQKQLKDLHIEERQQDKEEKVIFDFVQCDICHAFPIKGIAFKCLICSDFDLCQNCQATYHHFHPTLRMTKPHHYPTEISVTFPYESRKYLNQQHEKENQEIKEAKRLELLKPKKEKAEEVDPQSLSSRNVKAPNFLSQVLGQSC